MKTLFKAIAIASLASTAVVAQAETTASFGYSNSYQFRGVELASDNLYSAGIATELSGVSVAVDIYDASGNGTVVNGTAWDGFQEVDITLGYSLQLGNVGLDVGYVQREYETDNAGGNNFAENLSDNEFSASVTASGLTITLIDGEVDRDIANTPNEEYNVITLAYSVGNIDVTLGQVDIDQGDEYNYYEISTGTELFGLDANLMLTDTFSEDDGNDPAGVNEQEARIVVSLSKAISL